MQVVLIVSSISVLIAIGYLAFALGGPNTPSSPHPHDAVSSTREPVNLERTLVPESWGDTTAAPKLSIDKEFIDSMGSCHFCTRVEYSPRLGGKATVAFRSDGLDLTGYQRLVFFARGEEEQKVTFMAIGTRIISGIDGVGASMVPGEHFAVVTKNVTLDNTWQRFEIDLSQTSLERIIHPFGFVLTDDGSGKKQIIYLKGLTFDRKVAKNPITLANLAS